MKKQYYLLDDKYESYLKDESKLVGEAQEIAFPEQICEIEELIRYANKNQKSITIQGSRTGLVGGAVPMEGLVINFTRFRKIEEIEVLGEYALCKVEAGVTLKELRYYIETSKFANTYFWPPSPTESTATIGGIIANNAKGLNWFYYGEVVQYIHELTVLQKNGEIRYYNQQEHHVQINNFIGSEGEKGIVLNATLKLIKKQQNIWGLMFFFKQEMDTWEFVDCLSNTNYSNETAFISAIEYFDRSTIELIEEQKSVNMKLQEIPDIDKSYQSALYFEIEGEESEIEEIAARLLQQSYIYNSDGEATWAVSGESELEKMRLFRHAAPEALGYYTEKARRNDNRIYKLSGDFVLSNHTFVEIMSYYKAVCGEYDIKYCIFGHAGNRQVQLNFIVKDYKEFQQGVNIYKRIIKEKSLQKQQLSFEQGIGKIKKILLEELE